MCRPSFLLDGTTLSHCSFRQESPAPFRLAEPGAGRKKGWPGGNARRPRAGRPRRPGRPGAGTPVPAPGSAGQSVTGEGDLPCLVLWLSLLILSLPLSSLSRLLLLFSFIMTIVIVLAETGPSQVKSTCTRNQVCACLRQGLSSIPRLDLDGPA